MSMESWWQTSLKTREGQKRVAGRRKGGFGGRKKGENARFGRILKGDPVKGGTRGGVTVT